METNKDEYHLSFFKPTTEQARVNRNLTVFLISIWAIAVFGFQIALRVIEKPTPEPILLEYEQTLPQLENGAPTTEVFQKLSSCYLGVLSKVFIAPADKATLQKAFSSNVYAAVSAESKESLLMQIKTYEEIVNSSENISDERYVAARDALNKNVAELMGYSTTDLRTSMIAYNLKSEYFSDSDMGNKVDYHAVMKKYTTHNQSFLTDTPFLGFPFHYFYTAVFLLILFVFLCLLYCIRTDASHKKLAVNDNM